MAQTFTSTACQTFGTTGFFINPPKFIEEGYVVRAATYNFASNASATASAVIQMVPVPKGAQLHDVTLAWDMQGGGGVYTLKVGDGGSDARYIPLVSATASGCVRMGQTILNVSSAGNTLVTTISGGLGYSYSTDDTIDIVVSAAGNATLTGVVRVTIAYSMDNNQKG